MGRVSPKEMVLHYLLEHRNKREFKISPYHRDEIEEYRSEFEARGATLAYDPLSRIMTVSHPERFRVLVNDAEVWKDRVMPIAGCLLLIAWQGAVVGFILIALNMGAEPYVGWFGFLAVLCLGGALYEVKDRRTRLFLAAIFTAISCSGLPWGKWFP